MQILGIELVAPTLENQAGPSDSSHLVSLKAMDSGPSGSVGVLASGRTVDYHEDLVDDHPATPEPQVC